MKTTMRKTMYLVLGLLLVGSVSVNAQVTIGTQEPPHPAAVLDLQSEGTPGKGLLLPNVVISNLLYFGLSGVEAEAEGMIVYNSGNLVPKGVYVWNGSKWILLAATEV